MFLISLSSRFFGRISSDPNGYDIETLEVIKANASGLKGISGERIWSELRLILTGNHGPLIFEKMLSIGMAPYIGMCNIVVSLSYFVYFSTFAVLVICALSVQHHLI